MSSSDLTPIRIESEKQVEMVTKLLQRTKEGKLAWEKSGASISASLGPLEASFIRQSGDTSRWIVFTTRFEGNEVIDVTSRSPRIEKFAAAAISDPLVRAIDALFRLVGGTSDDLDKGIKFLDTL